MSVESDKQSPVVWPKVEDFERVAKAGGNRQFRDAAQIQSPEEIRFQAAILRANRTTKMK